MRLQRWCCKLTLKLTLMTSLGSVQLVGFFDVAARLRSDDGPIEAFVGEAKTAVISVFKRNRLGRFGLITWRVRPNRFITEMKSFKRISPSSAINLAGDGRRVVDHRVRDTLRHYDQMWLISCLSSFAT